MTKALESGLPQEAAQRARQVLDAFKRPPPPSPDGLRSRRAVRVLELIGSPAAREILNSLAGGLASDPQTRDARAALNRLAAAGAGKSIPRA